MSGEAAQPGSSRDEFVKNLDESGLSSLQELRQAADDAGGTTGSVLADDLVAAGKLTRYQAECILARRFDDLVIGNYEVLDRLGAGAMGTVYKARHRRMKRVVALKVLSKDVARQEAFAQRFQREVEVIAQLTHPNIVMAFDADEYVGGPFLVMEFVNGRDLSSEVAKTGALSVADALECILQAGQGLEYAHTQGIVHRDIKPGNILRDASGMIKVADLGLARISGSEGRTSNTSLTQAGGVVGTVDYMPPEQALDSTKIDHRADIYSLGCTLYYLLVGKPPYEGTTILAVLLKHREAPIPALCAARPDAPHGLDAIFQRMVAKRAEDRYQKMTDVVAALEELKRTAPLPTTRPGAPAAGTQSVINLGGSTVSLDPEQADTARKSASMASRVAGRSVVLAEPSRTQTGIIRGYLRQLGIEVVSATNSGLDAIALAKQERADVLISAMHLSDMTGVELAHELLADPECVGVGFILATSEAESEEAGALPDSHRVVRMLKPFDPQKLAESIAHAIG
ncbi:MAG: protein kinase [Planctomycetia bacterium]|nr:protein kinase [Planctomycetia bacterium]